MEVSYGIREADGDFETCDTLEIALAMSEPSDEIWICVDGTPIEALPGAFNRLVVAQDGREIRSAVLATRRPGYELVALDDVDTSPLPAEMPLLVIDHRQEMISVVTPA